MEAKRTKYFSIPVPHKPGELARFAKHLKEKGVNLTGLWGFGMGPERAEILAVASEPAKLQKALEGTSWQANERTCFYLVGEDRIGVLVDLLEPIAAAGINVEAVDVIGLEGRCGAYLWCDAKDLEKVGKLLKA